MPPDGNDANLLLEIYSSGSLPESYSLGQELDWDADPLPVILFVELPFWLMVSNCPLQIDIRGHTFRVEIAGDFVSLYGREVHNSGDTCIYMGPDVTQFDPEIQKRIKEDQIPVLPRKCKTVLRIHSRCNADVLAAINDEGRRMTEAYFYLKALCEAHFEVINHVVQHYRLSTYDYFPYEVSPWDVPVWYVDSGSVTFRVVLQDYAEWDYKPILTHPGARDLTYALISPPKLQDAMVVEPSAGELELLDALNFMERGDYSGAVRRITTAIEAILDSVLRRELMGRYPEPEVESRLRASQNDFPGRLRQYQNLSGRDLPADLADELNATRNLRHNIVHRGERITFANRGQAQRAVDTGRWIFNWIEDNPDRRDVRETSLAFRSLGRHRSYFDAEITPNGVIVHKPPDTTST